MQCSLHIHAISVTDTGCGRLLGMTAGDITRGQMKASSTAPDFDINDARLYGDGAWCADSPTDQEPYFQVGVEKNSLENKAQCIFKQVLSGHLSR